MNFSRYFVLHSLSIIFALHFTGKYYEEKEKKETHAS
jgi:hypothetical protein